MATTTVKIQSGEASGLRPLNIFRDLPQVADLIELCFSATMDEDGQSYLQQMRHASRDASFLQWANSAIEGASVPLSGIVWEENGKIVGNVSLVAHNYKSRKITLIANVATHPDYRRRGIGRALTERAMFQARQKGAKELWLQVRNDNPTAIKIYRELGFVERARRTTYQTYSKSPGTSTTSDVTVTRMKPYFWPLQREWLRRAHPDELSWYWRWDWRRLGPGFQMWLHRFFVEFDLRQWAATKNGKLLASVSWLGATRPTDLLWVATPLNGDGAGLRSALEAACGELINQHKLTVEYPAGEMVEAIQAAGFRPQRTLIWMCATS
ncbi:MAG TPA: GNAT family N-acetyltransferase [Anaerolineales bacterium]|nr:GNAT family N-acetyltransferase [Anaerolineales bacterium]